MDVEAESFSVVDTIVAVNNSIEVALPPLAALPVPLSPAAPWGRKMFPFDEQIFPIDVFRSIVNKDGYGEPTILSKKHSVLSAVPDPPPMAIKKMSRIPNHVVATKDWGTQRWGMHIYLPK